MTEIPERFDLKARMALSQAVVNSQHRQLSEVSSLDLLAVVTELKDKNVEVVFLATGVSSGDFTKKLRQMLLTREKQPPLSVEITFSESTKRVLDTSLRLASQRHAERASVDDIFLAILSDQEIEETLRGLGMDCRPLAAAAWEMMEYTPTEISLAERRELVKELRTLLGETMRTLAIVNRKLLWLEYGIEKTDTQ